MEYRLQKRILAVIFIIKKIFLGDIVKHDVLSPVIIYTEHVWHIGHIDKPAVSLVKPPFIQPFLHRLAPLVLESKTKVHRSLSCHTVDIPMNLLILPLSLLDLAYCISAERGETFLRYKFFLVGTDFFNCRVFIDDFIIRNEECLQYSWVRRKGEFKKPPDFPDALIITRILDFVLII